MKLHIVISVIFFIALCFAANFYFLKLSMMPFIGILLVALIVLGIVVNLFTKANRKRKGVEGEPNAFIFPDKVAKGMKEMSVGIQYEASVISCALLILGIILFLVYYVFFTSSPWLMKGLIIFNSVCGMGLMGGMLVTYFQQLVAYRESTRFIQDFARQTPHFDKTPSLRIKKQPPLETEPEFEPESEYFAEYPSNEFAPEPDEFEIEPEPEFEPGFEIGPEPEHLYSQNNDYEGEEKS
jgi:hypothetical protein